MPTNLINLSNEMQKQLSSEIQGILSDCSKVAKEFGFSIYLIGGVVRDLFLKKEIFDVDITVEGNAIEFCHKLVEKGLCRILQVQDNLKTVKTVFANGTEIDFASTRQEFYPRRGHLPVVVKVGCKLEEDVLRRDFTVNALAISLNDETFGSVIDYVGGVKDLKDKKLKVLHDNSFVEDPSRIIRGLKFASRFNFRRDDKTKKLQEDYQNNCLNRDISWTRVKAELNQAFSLNKADVYDKFLGTEIYKLLYAQKSDLNGSEIKSLIDLKHPEKPWLVYLGTILTDKELIEAFCFTRQEKKIFVDRDNLLSSELGIINSNYYVYKFFEKKSLESVLIYYLLTQRKEALLFIEKLSKIRVELSGDDLKSMGIVDGKEIGKMLDEILRKKLSGSLVNRADEISFVNSKRK